MDLDTQVQMEGRLLDIVDSAWRQDQLPCDDIFVPVSELPDPDADNGDSTATLKEVEAKWTDLSLGSFYD